MRLDHTALRLERPGALALGTNGTLYIADTQRDQILEYLPDGILHIVAGTGKAGFSGDGGLARRAELHRPLGIAVAQNGILYFADAGNNRIRAVTTDGLISTVAGNGKSGWVRSGTPARAASILDPAAVSFGPDGRLYIAALGDNEILRLERSGMVTEIAGNRHYSGLYGLGGPAKNASPDSPDALAFDRSGNLYIAGSAVKTLLVITPRGIMRAPAGIETFYPRGSGDMAMGPGGSVYAANTLTLVQVTPYGMKPVLNFQSRRVAGLSGFLPEGIAVGRNGQIYSDTWKGNGFANKTVLLKIRSGGLATILWKG